MPKNPVPVTASILACGITLLLASTHGENFAAAEEFGMDTAIAGTPAPTVPGDNLGGDLTYDGFDDQDISRSGLYGMIYHLDTLTENECTTEAKKATKNIDIFDMQGKTNEYYLREKGGFQPTGPTSTLQPGDELSVSSSQAVTKNWEISATVETTVGSSWVASVRVAVTGSYGEAVTTTTTDTATAKNPTSDMIQERAYGIFSDIWAVQRSPWTVAWQPGGSKIFAGDDLVHAANWYTVKTAGCYRAGYFSTLLMPRSKGHGVVREYPKDGSKSCPHSITGEGVKLYPPKKSSAGGTEPDESDTAELIDVDPGTCVHLSGKAPAGDGKWIELAKVKKNPKNGLCPAQPKQLCSTNYWARSSDLTAMNLKPTPLTTWGDGTQLTIRSVADDAVLSSTASDPAKGVNVSVTKSDAKDRWKLENAGSGTWRLVNSGGGANGECLNPWLLTDSSGRAKIGTVGCHHTRAGVEWRLVFASTGPATFYLHSISDQGCAESADGGAVIGKCDGTKQPQQFELSA